jgi:hypothetical protein
VYFVISGTGSTVINGAAYRWGPGDVFVVPNWSWHEFVNGAGESYLFSITDEPVMRALGMLREQGLHRPRRGTSRLPANSTVNSMAFAHFHLLEQVLHHEKTTHYRSYRGRTFPRHVVQLSAGG